MENNMAFVARLKNITKIEGADKIVKADVVLNDAIITQVVVGNDTIEDTPIVYFDSNLCINENAISIIDKQSENYGTENFHSLGAYLGKAGRVRCIKLKSVISNGLAVEIDKFYSFFKSQKEAINTLVEGFSFTNINTIEICKKYSPPVRSQSVNNPKGRKGKKVPSRLIAGQFSFHIDTAQLARNLNAIHPNDLISISNKVHGTSSIVSNCLVKRKLNWFERILKTLKVNINDTQYDYLYASRTVVKNEKNSGTGFYSVDVWTDAGSKFKGKLHSGESVYFEIIGYLPGTSSFIQKGYNYGCSEGEYKIKIYRITKTGADGDIVEYSWDMLKERCKELDVEMVEEYYYGKASLLFPEIIIDDSWNTNFLSKLKETYLEKMRTDCVKAVPDEGIVIRRCTNKNIEVYKLKSEKFLLGESKEAEEGIVSIEDTQE